MLVSLDAGDELSHVLAGLRPSFPSDADFLYPFLLLLPERRGGRGRNAGRPAPPGLVPACAVTALSSWLEQ